MSINSNPKDKSITLFIANKDNDSTTDIAQEEEKQNQPQSLNNIIKTEINGNFLSSLLINYDKDSLSIFNYDENSLESLIKQQSIEEPHITSNTVNKTDDDSLNTEIINEKDCLVMVGNELHLQDMEEDSHLDSTVTKSNNNLLNNHIINEKDIFSIVEGEIYSQPMEENSHLNNLNNPVNKTENENNSINNQIIISLVENEIHSQPMKDPQLNNTKSTINKTDDDPLNNEMINEKDILSIVENEIHSQPMEDPHLNNINSTINKTDDDPLNNEIINERDILSLVENDFFKTQNQYLDFLDVDQPTLSNDTTNDSTIDNLIKPDFIEDTINIPQHFENNNNNNCNDKPNIMDIDIDDVNTNVNVDISKNDHENDIISYILNINKYLETKYNNSFPGYFVSEKNWFQKTIIENYLKFCEIMHKTHLNIICNFFPNKESSKFNLCIQDLNYISCFDKFNFIQLKIYHSAMADPYFSSIINNSFLKIMQMNRMASSYMMKPIYTPLIFPIKCNFTNNSYKINHCNTNMNTNTTTNINTNTSAVSVHKKKNKMKKSTSPSKNKKRISNGNEVISRTPKHPYDFYTPRFVRGKGFKRMGKCPCCPQQPGTWYATKTSAYSYHLSTSHGISSSTLTTYNKPSKYRVTFINRKTKKQEEIVFPEILIKYDHIQPSQDQDITNKLWPSPYQFNGSLSKEAYCKECDQWINLTTDTDASSVKKIYKNWWKHSRLYHSKKKEIKK